MTELRLYNKTGDRVETVTNVTETLGTSSGKPRRDVRKNGVMRASILQDTVAPPPPPPAPTVEIVSATGGAGFVDYSLTSVGAGFDLIVGLDPNSDTLPKRVHSIASQVTGRLENVPAGTYSLWAAQRDSTGKDLDTATPQSVTVTLPTVPPPVPPVPPTNEQPSFDGSANLGFAGWTVQEWGGKVVIENSPTLSGHKAFKFNSQAAAYDNGPRCEIAENFTIREGDDWWFGDVGYIKSGQPQWQSGNHTVWQWKNEGTGSPPLNLDIRSWYGLQAQAELPSGLKYVNIIPFSELYDRAFRLEAHVKFSADPNVGFFEIWVDGKVVVPATKMSTLYTGLGCYFKQGQYGNQQTTYNFWHGVKRGRTRASVLR